MVNGPTRGDQWGRNEEQEFFELDLWHRYISYDSTITDVYMAEVQMF